MSISGKRILITGGAGFIGSHLCERLAQENDVTIYDNFGRNAIRFTELERHPRVRLAHGDVLDLPSLLQAGAGHQLIIHCAAIAGIYSVDKDPLLTMQVNVLGTYHVLQAAAAAGAERLVDFSTSEVYGPYVRRGTEQDQTAIGPVGELRWVYAASKLAAEHWVFAFARRHRLACTTVRPFNVYGPRQIGEGAIQRMVLRAIAGEPITLYNDGTQIRAWCYIDDFIDGVLACLERPQAVGEVFNLGNPQGTTTNLQLALTIKRLTGSSSKLVFEPHPGPEVEIRIPSIAQAQSLLDYRPQVLLEQGISRTIEWYRAHADALG